MTQLSPTNVTYTQFLGKINDLRQQYDTGKILSPHDLMVELEKTVHDYMSNLGLPATQWDPIAVGEPPSSEKINRFWRTISEDLVNAQENLDLIRSSTIFTHNIIKTELMKARNENGLLANKLKTLQLYSTAQDVNVNIFGDYFKSKDFTDLSLTTGVDMQTEGQITLSKLESANLIGAAKITILGTSNGFSGNNQEILPPEDAKEDPVTKQKAYQFYGQTNRNEKLDAVKDNNPVTWFEYESNYVFPGDIASAKSFNFTYQNNLGLEGGTQLNWAAGPDDGVLRLDLQIDLQSIRTINSVTYSPFGLVGNKNNPVKIKSISISEDATEWLTIGQQDVWVGTNTSLQTLRLADNVSLGDINWSFAPAQVRYVRFQIEQPNPLDANIGHLYYESKESTRTQEKRIPDPDNPGEWLIVQSKIAFVKGGRVEGPNPKVSDPGEFYRSDRTDFGEYVQKREYFQGKRWAIGIRDISVSDVKFAKVGTYISQPFRTGTVIDRVAIESDFILPEGFDVTQEWAKFYVSPNDGLNWFQISPISDSFNGIPEVVVFNDPLPQQFREQNSAYYQVSNTVESVRVKIVLSRPDNQPSSSPIVNNYRLKVRKR